MDGLRWWIEWIYLHAHKLNILRSHLFGIRWPFLRSFSTTNLQESRRRLERELESFGLSLGVTLETFRIFLWVWVLVCRKSCVDLARLWSWSLFLSIEKKSIFSLLKINESLPHFPHWYVHGSDLVPSVPMSFCQNSRPFTWAKSEGMIPIEVPTHLD